MKKALCTGIFSVILVVLMAIPALGAPLIGTRSMGMGGTAIATVNDGTAPYWNPAGLSLHKFALTSSTMGEASIAGFGQMFDLIGGIDWSTVTDFETAYQQLLNGMQTVLTSESLELNAGTYFGLTCKWVGLTGYGVASTSAIIDGTSGNIIVDAEASAAGMASAALSFKHVPGIEWVALGANVKAIAAFQAHSEIDPTTDTQVAGYTASGTGFAGDGGLMVQITEKFRAGVVVKDIAWNVSGTRTEYDGATSAWLLVHPMTLSLGAALFPVKGMTLAADVQGINLSEFSNTDFFSANLGFEQKLGPLFLRAGAFMELPAGTPAFSVSAGAGLKLWALRSDLAATYQIGTGNIGLQGLLALQW